jgi:hypothetical protein
MPERLVDVVKNNESLLHVFPVTIDDESASDTAFQLKALEGAAHSHLVPEQELVLLNARMHLSHGGPLEPCGDSLGVMAETKEGLDQVSRERAYLLWEQAGRPEGQSDAFWHKAQHQRFSERAYALWEREGRPNGKANENWFRVRAFEEI